MHPKIFKTFLVIEIRMQKWKFIMSTTEAKSTFEMSFVKLLNINFKLPNVHSLHWYIAYLYHNQLYFKQLFVPLHLPFYFTKQVFFY